jgi:hypothetical protein
VETVEGVDEVEVEAEVGVVPVEEVRGEEELISLAAVGVEASGPQGRARTEWSLVRGSEGYIYRGNASNDHEHDFLRTFIALSRDTGRAQEKGQPEVHENCL